MLTHRYQLIFVVPDSVQGIEGLRNYLMDVFLEMRKYSKNRVVLLPWQTEATDNKIEKPDDIPNNFSDLEKYFEGIKSPDLSKNMYTKIRLGYPIHLDRQTFEVDIQGWGSARKINLYETSVQHPNVRSIGWLVYMPRSVNKKNGVKQ